MVKRILISSLLLISFGCSPIKKINNNVVSGEFDKAINKTISELKKIKNKKKKIQYELILKDIYNRAVVNSKDKISRFKKDGNPEFFDDIYFEYDKLIKRQNKLKNLSSERLNFNFENYDSELINFRYKTSDYLLKISNSFISNNNKFDYRKAYNYLTVIESINPNYLDTRSLIKLCLAKGKDYILLNVHNESKSVLFEDLEKDILNIKGYDLNSTWKSFFTKNDSFEGTYDFYIDLAFKSFIISPERLIQKEGFSEKNIVDGLTYKLDDEGNVMKDSLGNDIKVDKLIKISVKSIESIQSKSAKVLAEIRFIDKKKNIIDKFPLESEFWFRNRFLEYDGDKRVLTKEQIKLSKNRFIPFPPDEVLIFNNSENIKRKMKRIIYKSFN